LKSNYLTQELTHTTTDATGKFKTQQELFSKNSSRFFPQGWNLNSETFLAAGQKVKGEVSHCLRVLDVEYNGIYWCMHIKTIGKHI